MPVKPQDLRMFRKAFGAQVRHYRKSRGMTQEDLAETSNIDRTYIGGIERGVKNPSLDNIAKIAKSLGVPVAELLVDVEKENTKKLKGIV